MKMSRFILTFILLLNFYICEKEEGKIKIFDVEVERNIINEFNVKVGEEFGLKFFCSPGTGNVWILLNRTEFKDPIAFIKTGSEPYHYVGEELGLGSGSYLYYYFKAVSVTKEPKLLNFIEAHTYLQQENPIPSEFVKINVS